MNQPTTHDTLTFALDVLQHSPELKSTTERYVWWLCDCAERVLPLVAAWRPTEQRPANALKAARHWVKMSLSGDAAASDAAVASAASDAADASAASAVASAASAVASAVASAASAAADAASAAADAASAASAAYRYWRERWSAGGPARAVRAVELSAGVNAALCEQLWQVRRRFEICTMTDEEFKREVSCELC